MVCATFTPLHVSTRHMAVCVGPRCLRTFGKPCGPGPYTVPCLKAPNSRLPAHPSQAQLRLRHLLRRSYGATAPRLRLQDGASALYLAAQNGHVGIARMLVAAGANLELVDLVRRVPAGSGLRVARDFAGPGGARTMQHRGLVSRSASGGEQDSGSFGV